MKKLLQTEFGFGDIKVSELNGYGNINYMITTLDARYVFKTYHQDKDVMAQLIAENEVLSSIQDENKFKYPRLTPFLDGSFIKVLRVNHKDVICRMLTYIEGELLVNVPHTEELFTSFGYLLAEMNLLLLNFNNDTIKARQSGWCIQGLNLNMKLVDDIADLKNRNVVKYFLQQCQEHVLPVLPELRQSTIHNDANDWNILVNEGVTTSVIDFGDLAYSALINEVAVAIAYACIDKEDPLKWAVILLKSYHEKLPLIKKEVAILYYLIAARWVVSVCNSAHAIKLNPENHYLQVSEKPAWAMLYKWLTINPIAAENHFYAALDMPIETPVSVAELTHRRQACMSPLVSTSYDQAINMDRSAFQYMYDVYGNTYLDAYNNIPQVGHSHPKVVEAGQRQMSRLNTNTRYLYDILPKYAEKLLSKFPDNLNKVYFVNSGSAASDLAIRLVHAHTKHRTIMVMEHGYHGNTLSSMDISDYKFSNKKGTGLKDFIIKTAIPDTYRGQYTNNDGSAGKQYASDAIKQIENTDQTVAAFISEPIVGCGGQVPLAKGYLKELYPAIRSQGGLCISDEVQTGFGRMGDWFWGYEAQDVVPDIVILGKPMANGHPMGAVVTRTEVAESFGKGVEFFSSFGGNPVSCAIALSVLEVIEDEQLQHNAKVVGDYYLWLLKQLADKYPCIGDVRGSGLFIGVEITQDDSDEANTVLAHLIKNKMRENYILISTDGPYDNVLKTKPALCFTKLNAQTVVKNIAKILDSYYQQKK
ncbi:MAG: aminotransferase class III-fold pyridoxal phosphate-dependent enzyme [Alcanivoracaceae bacterium]|nr:aminotransferase class III-fold pyridoxal phosphate-dependent enzyme [Alcanivoracaceae bacterium]